MYYSKKTVENGKSGVLLEKRLMLAFAIVENALREAEVDYFILQELAAIERHINGLQSIIKGMKFHGFVPEMYQESDPKVNLEN